MVNRNGFKSMHLSGSYIYFLAQGNRVVYVGKSESLLKRLSVHAREKRGDFDRVHFIEVPSDELDEWERSFAFVLRPEGQGQIPLPDDPRIIRAAAELLGFDPEAVVARLTTVEARLLEDRFSRLVDRLTPAERARLADWLRTRRLRASDETCGAPLDDDFYETILSELNES